MNIPTDQPNRHTDDETDLFELAAIVWQHKWLVVICTLVVLIICGGYVYVSTPTYRLSAQISATTDLTTPIRLSKLWNAAYNSDKNFTTPVLAQYAENESPYSSTSLFLRFGELLSSEDMKKRFIETHPQLEGAALVRRLNVSFPKRLESNLGLVMMLATKDLRQLEQAAQTTNTYLLWSHQAFRMMIENEINEAIGQPTINITDPTYLVAITSKAEIPKRPTKPNKALIMALSAIFGVMFGVLAALIRGAISKRQSA